MRVYWNNLAYLFKPLPPTFEKLKETVKSLLVREEELLNSFNAIDHPKKVYWDNKHSEKMINYDARNIPYTKIRITMDVRTFITPEEISITRWVHKHKELLCDNPLNYDDKIRSFYLSDREDFFYAYDSITAKVSEVWLFPFELSFAGRGDCEDHAHRMKSRLNALGLPDWRSRVVCGVARNGGGHSTVYYLADDLETWIHLNSTTHKNDVGETLPTINDDNDNLGIGSVWFSFNKEKSWADFEVSDDGGTKRFKYVKIL